MPGPVHRLSKRYARHVGKKKKTKFEEVICFCPKRADIESILNEAITKERSEFVGPTWKRSP